eukprot:5286601-Amphidinium_carterae.1
MQSPSPSMECGTTQWYDDTFLALQHKPGHRGEQQERVVGQYQTGVRHTDQRNVICPCADQLIGAEGHGQAA